MGVSFLGHYLLCRLLLPVLRHGHSRVIGQSSVAMANSYLRGIDPKSWTSKPQAGEEFSSSRFLRDLSSEPVAERGTCED